MIIFYLYINNINNIYARNTGMENNYIFTLLTNGVRKDKIKTLADKDDNIIRK